MLASAAFLFAAGYDSAEIRVPLEHPAVLDACIGEDGTVGGYACDTQFVMADSSSLAIPFVWQNGKTFLLPTGVKDYGRVYAVGQDLVVGDVHSDRGWMPAKWTPDSEQGWSKPTLHLLGVRPGSAVQIDPDGAIWVASRESYSRFKGGEITTVDTPRFDFIGADLTGRAFGTFFNSIGPINRREGQRAGCLDKEEPVYLFQGEEASTVIDVAPDGTVLAQSRTSQGVTFGTWKNGAFTPSQTPSAKVISLGGFAGPGAVFGCFQTPDRDSFPAILKGETLTDLSQSVPSLTMSEIVFADAKGRAIVKSGDFSEWDRCFLVTPKPDRGTWRSRGASNST